MTSPHASTESGATILVVDDNEAVTQIFARMLAFEGYRVRTALDAATGLWEAAANLPDAIILDLRMPIMDGLDFLRRLRAISEQRSTPVAIVTGDYFVEDSVSAELRELGAELTYKPLWLEDLVGLTRALLALKRTNRPPRSKCTSRLLN
jgi:DNA-binding response OmpR family regulator